MQYQHPDWNKTARRNAWVRRTEAAFLAVLVLGGAVALLSWLKPWQAVLPGSTPAPLLSETEIPRPPSPEGAARAFLDGWQTADYPKMYSLLAAATRAGIPQDAFASFYNGVRVQTTLRTLDYAILSVDLTPNDATIQFEVTLHTILVGDITKQTRMLMKYEGDGWKIAWDRQAVLPELENGNNLVMRRDVPARGNIYDRAGLPLAAEAEVVEVGVIPGEITDQDAILTRLSAALRMQRELVRLKITEAMPDKYIAIGEAAAADIPGGSEPLARLGGVYVNISTRR